MGLYSNPDGGTFQRYQSSSIQEYQCFESCNSEAAEYQRHHTLQCGCFKHRALVPNHSFCKSAQYLRSSFELCEQFGLTEEEKVQERPLGKKESVSKGVLISVKSQEVNLLVSSPRLASGSSWRENIQDFESLSETIRFTRVCEDAIFVHRGSAGMSYKTRPDESNNETRIQNPQSCSRLVVWQN